MSNLALDQSAYSNASQAEERELSKLSKVRLIPRITVQAFCETEAISRTLEQLTSDRRMTKAHVKVHMGGIAAATDFYASAPTPNLIILETKKSGDQLINELMDLASVCDASTKVIVVGIVNDIIMYRDLINRGITEYLVAPVTLADILSVISEIYTDPDQDTLGKTIAFVGAKGGIGSSTISHNIAWAIASEFEAGVVLSDLDLPFGTANINLDQDPSQGIADGVFSADRIDDILLDRLLTKCSEHLSLLAAPSTLERTYDFDTNAFTQLIEVAQRGAPHIVLDVPHQWNGWTQQVLASADEVVITASPDLPNLRNAKNILDKMRELRPNDAKPKLVLNQVGIPKKPEIGVNDFVAPLDLEPVAVIPFDPGLFGNAANNGHMISESDPKSAIAATFVEMAQILTGKAEFKTRKRSGLDLGGLLSRIKKSK